MDNGVLCLTPVLAIGNFDGVHLGHISLLRQTVAIASSLNQVPAALTFYPHPKAILNGLKDNIYITDIKTRIRKIKQLGIQHVYIMRPNPRMLKMKPEEFIETVLHKKIRASHVVIGANFLFGRNRSGNAQTMQRTAAAYGISATVAPLFCLSSGERYSSSDIRKQIGYGNLQIVEQMLGGNYTIQGRVVYGQNLGKKLGFPTANININNIVKPPLGVYIAQFSIEGAQYKWAVVNIGTKPTIASNNQNIILEAHIIDFSQNIYRKSCEVRLQKFIRREQKFASLNELQNQIIQDIEVLRAHIANTS